MSNECVKEGDTNKIKENGLSEIFFEQPIFLSN